MGAPLGQVLALAIRDCAILRVDLDSGEVTTFLTDAGARPDGVLVHDGSVYWTAMGTPEILPDRGRGEVAQDYSARDGAVHAIDVDGGNRRDVVAPGGLTTGKQIACDDEWLYWSDREGCRVSRARFDGSGREDLVVNDGSRGILDECVGVAVDADHGHLYWTQKGPAKGGQGRILRAGLRVPDGETAASRSDIEVLWDGLPEPIDLEISDGWLYWTDRGAPPLGNTLNRAPLPATGAAGAPPEILLEGLREGIGIVVDEERGWVHASDLGGTIHSVPVPGGPAAGAGARHLAAGRFLTGLALWR